MRVIPSIDIMDGKCVRLIRGEKHTCITYDVDPLEMAAQYVKKGAGIIHVIDLDGAFTGTMKNINIIKQLAQQFPIQVGGGVRDEKTIKLLFSFGVKKVVLGTLLVKNPQLAKDLKKRYYGRIIGSLDIRGSKVTYGGWTKEMAIPFKQIMDGILEIVVTDTEQDGTLSGPNLKLLKNIKSRCNAKIIAAGGIRDVLDLMELKNAGMDGVIVGRAFFENKISLKNGFRFQMVD